jgi:hypothetical protein
MTTLSQTLLDSDAFEDRVKKEVDRFVSLNQVKPCATSIHGKYFPKTRVICSSRTVGSFVRVVRLYAE